MINGLLHPEACVTEASFLKISIRTQVRGMVATLRLLYGHVQIKNSVSFPYLDIETHKYSNWESLALLYNNFITKCRSDE